MAVHAIFQRTKFHPRSYTGPSPLEVQVSGFEDAFKSLGRSVHMNRGCETVHFDSLTPSTISFIFSVGCELAKACQPFGESTDYMLVLQRYLQASLASTHLTDHSVSLPELISPRTTKARLLHYFSPPADQTLSSSKEEPVDSWCGFHLDHSLITGLCSVCDIIIYYC